MATGEREEKKRIENEREKKQQVQDGATLHTQNKATVS
jgi:hypothetical protein